MEALLKCFHVEKKTKDLSATLCCCGADVGPLFLLLDGAFTAHQGDVVALSKYIVFLYVFFPFSLSAFHLQQIICAKRRLL